MFCSTEQVVIIHLDQVNKTYIKFFILALSPSLLLEQRGYRGDMEIIYHEFALNGSKHLSPRTAFPPLPEVSTRALTPQISRSMQWVIPIGSRPFLMKLHDQAKSEKLQSTAFQCHIFLNNDDILKLLKIQVASKTCIIIQNSLWQCNVFLSFQLIFGT